MKQFFHQRANQKNQEMMKYMRYVFNDHFVLVLLFLLGAGAYSYSNFVQTLSSSSLGARIFLVLLLGSSFLIGKNATLLRKADLMYLLPKTNKMIEYVQASFKRSLLFPLFLEAMILGALMPLIVVVTKGMFTEYFLYLVFLWAGKITLLKLEMMELFSWKIKETKKVYFLLGLFICLVLTFFVQRFVGIFIGLVLSLLVFLLLKIENTNDFHLRRAVAREEKRSLRVYKFISLFTDVPYITSNVKRRKWMDVCLAFIPKVHGKSYSYLYLRAFLRGGDYFGLVIRLLGIGVLVLVMMHEKVLMLIIGAILLYLIVFQLFPLFEQFDYMVLTHLYPIQKQQKNRNFVSVIAGIVLPISFLFSLLALKIGIEALALLLVGTLLTFAYTPLRIKKMEK